MHYSQNIPHKQITSMIEFELEMANAFESFGQDMDVAHFPSMDGTLQIKLGDKVTYVNCQKK